MGPIMTKLFADFVPKSGFELIGFLLACSAAALAADFGASLAHTRTMSFFFGMAFACLAFGSYLLPDKACEKFESGKSTLGSLAVLGYLACAFGATIGTWSAGSTHRMATSSDAGVVNATYEGLKKSVVEAEEAHAVVVSNRDKLILAHGWMTTTTTQALRDELASIEGDKLFKRSKGCKNVTLDDSKEFCANRLAVQEKIAIIEARDKLDPRIEAAHAAVERARLELAAAKKTVAASDVSSAAIASFWYSSMKPGEEPTYWSTLALAGLIAFLLEFLPGIIKALSRDGRAAALISAAPSAPKARPVTYAEQLRAAQPATAQTVNETHNHYVIDLLAEKSMLGKAA